MILLNMSNMSNKYDILFQYNHIKQSKQNLSLFYDQVYLYMQDQENHIMEDQYMNNISCFHKENRNIAKDTYELSDSQVKIT